MINLFPTPGDQDFLELLETDERWIELITGSVAHQDQLSLVLFPYSSFHFTKVHCTLAAFTFHSFQKCNSHFLFFGEKLNTSAP